MRIFFDTNFIIYCIQQKIQFIEQLREKIHEKYELIILKSVLNELEMLKSRKKRKEKEAAKTALDLIKSNKNFKIFESAGKSADDILVNFDSKDSVIATIDKRLRKRFKNACFLTIKRKKYIDFV